MYEKPIWGQSIIYWNLKVVVKVTTDIKLNLISDKGESLIKTEDSEEQTSKEVHYM